MYIWLKIVKRLDYEPKLKEVMDEESILWVVNRGKSNWYCMQKKWYLHQREHFMKLKYLSRIGLQRVREIHIYEIVFVFEPWSLYSHVG